MDTVKTRRKITGRERDTQLMEKCETLWMNLSEMREQGARALRFTYGDQWADRIQVNGETMTMRSYLIKTGNIVMQTNQIKNKVDTIVGVMVKEKNEPICNARDRDEQQYGEVMTTALQANCNKNKMESLYIKWMKDLCIRGLGVCKERYDYGHGGRLDSWSEYVEPNTIFFDSEMTDPRFWDINLIGQFFDLTFEQLTARFARTEKDYSILKEIYHSQAVTFRENPIKDIINRDEDSMVFRTPEDPTRCRVFEIWTKETAPRYRVHDYNEGTEEIIEANDREALREIEAENKRRKALAKQAGWSDAETPLIEKEFFIDEFWYCRFLAQDSTIIWEGESPYADRSHPFTIVATPFVGGRIVGYMNDAIDHNIAMNRAIVLQDWLTRVQAKGVPIVPNQIVPNHDKQAFSNAWSSLDQIVFVDMKPGEEGLMPKVVSGNQTNFNAAELIKTYKSLMEDSVSVNGALQGKTAYSGTSGALYAQMAANSSTPIAALLSQFHTFLEELHTKKMKNIAMFYDTERLESIAGNIDSILDTSALNLNDVKDIEYDLSIQESTQTPVYRAIINDDAKEFLMNGLITMDEYLMIADVPYADKLMQYRQARQNEVQQIQEGQQPLPQQTG